MNFSCVLFIFFFFFNDTATTEIYTLSLHDALPIYWWTAPSVYCATTKFGSASIARASRSTAASRSEEHTSELQSRLHLVCRLLLEKKKKRTRRISYIMCTLKLDESVVRLFINTDDY